ncbi:toxin Cry1Ac domain D-VI-related protein [Bacillus wiedmannii]|nr:toxin Cry1Ac domain D-VI-related protein [Bacillus wiedmannii]
MLNNQSDCANDGCFRDSLNHVLDSKYQPGKWDSSDLEALGHNNWEGSFSFSSKIGDTLLIQLQNFPTMKNHHAGNIYFTTNTLIAWLETQLQSAKDSGTPVILNLHQPDSWNDHDQDQPESIADFTNLMYRYQDNIAAVFAGHYHYNTGRYWANTPFRNIPVFLSGSMLYKSYLILERYNDRMEIYLVCGNAWQSKNLIQTVELPLSSKTPLSFITRRDLALITPQVDELFTSSSYTELNPTVSNYQIDQVAMKIDRLSPTIFGQERASLRKLVATAKQLMRARNLLVDGSFETLTGWTIGGRTEVADNLSLFKGYYLALASNETPDKMSYAYQKVDESKLKPYTRYKVSGYIGHSHNLELSIYRYGNEIKNTLNIRHPDEFQPGCSNQTDSHFFSYHIDVGELHPELNPGIEFGLRIIPSNGFAVLSSLELVEERPLTDKEIQKIQRKEPRWQLAFEQERAESTTFLQPVIERINSFFRDANWNSEILSHVTYQDLYEFTLPTLLDLPSLRQWLREDREGEHYMLLQSLEEALERVHLHVEEQNLIHNGSFDAPFIHGLDTWLIEGDAQLTILDSGDRVLRLSNWDTSVSQAIDILNFDEEKEYQLHIRAKGAGTITIEHGKEVETIVLPSNARFYFYKSEPFSFETASFVLQLQSETGEFIVDHVAIIEVPAETETN